MSEEISIKVNIADVSYPLKVSLKDEENVRKAAKLINEKVRSYREDYQLFDKANILSMVALEIACELLPFREKNWIEDSGISEELKNLSLQLESLAKES